MKSSLCFILLGMMIKSDFGCKDTIKIQINEENTKKFAFSVSTRVSSRGGTRVSSEHTGTGVLCAQKRARSNAGLFCVRINSHDYGVLGVSRTAREWVGRLVLQLTVYSFFSDGFKWKIITYIIYYIYIIIIIYI